MMLPTGRCVLAQGRLIGRTVSISRAYTRSRLLSTLAVLEQKDGQLSHGSLSAFTAAKQLGGTVHGFIAGNNINAAAQDAARVEGVEKILVVDSAAYDKVCDHSS